MYLRYQISALDKVSSGIAGVRSTQIDMAYWRKTPLGLSFDQTIACPGGWLCLLRVFDGLQLIASAPGCNWGFVPAIRTAQGPVLKGYAALGYVLQEKPNPDSAEVYGRAMFALPGGGQFDGRIPVMDTHNPRTLINRRVAMAKQAMIEADREVTYKVPQFTL